MKTKTILIFAAIGAVLYFLLNKNGGGSAGSFGRSLDTAAGAFRSGNYATVPSAFGLGGQRAVTTVKPGDPNSNSTGSTIAASSNALSNLAKLFIGKKSSSGVSGGSGAGSSGQKGVPTTSVNRYTGARENAAVPETEGTGVFGYGQDYNQGTGEGDFGLSGNTVATDYSAADYGGTDFGSAAIYEAPSNITDEGD